MILNADKNLGSAIIERETYIKHILKEYLFDSTTYKSIVKEQSIELFKSTKIQIEKLLVKYRDYLTDDEIVYFTKSLMNNNQPP